MATLFSKAFVCPLTCDIMDDPVVLSDGVSYERRAAAEWCAACSRSPVTGEALVCGVAVPNTVLRAAIQRWRQTPKWRADVRAAELCAVRAECAALEAARVRAEHRLARATERLAVTQDRASSANGTVYELRLKTETVTQALRVARHQNEAAVYQAVLDHIRAERWEDAIVVSEKHKRNPQLAAVRGFAFQRMKNYASAMKEFQRALEMDNRNVVALNGMASLCSNLGKKEDALLYLDILESISPSADVLNSKAEILLQQGNTEKALICLNKSIQLDSSQPTAFCLRAKAFLAKEDQPQALLDVAEALRLDPHHAGALEIKALFTNELKEKNKCIVM